MRLRSLFFSLVFVTLLLVTIQSFAITSTKVNHTNSDWFDSSKNMNLAYTPHAPVVVTNDSEFLAAGFTGGGNETHPYVLEGVNITTDDTCINITETSSYFEIRNCYLTSTTGSLGYGIHTDFAPHGTIESTVITSKDTGIRVVNSDTWTVFNNSVTDCAGYGIIIYKSDHSIVENNTVQYTDSWGIFLRDVNDVQAINNTISRTQRGIVVDDNSEYCTIIDNTISHSEAEVVWLAHTTYCTLIKNDVFLGDSNGIDAFQSDHFVLTDNKFHENVGSGAILRESTNGTLTGNEFVYNGYAGINIQSTSSDMTIYDNLIGWNDNYEGLDNGAGNSWDDGVSLGNRWGNYMGTGTYLVSGTSGSIDMYPSKGDTIAPFIDPPEDIQLTYGDTGSLIRWSPVEAHPLTFIVERNRTELDSGSWSGGDIVVSLDGYEVGVYNLTVTVFDTCNNYATDTVFVTVTASTVSPTTTTTSASGPPPLGDPMIFVVFGGIGVFGLILIIVIIKKFRPGKDDVVFDEGPPPPPTGAVEVLRGGEIVSGKYVYKVKVNNGTDFVINNVIVTLIAYPEDCMVIEGETSKTIKRIEPGGFRSPSFTLKPTDDCVSGEILASVSYIDHLNENQLMKVEPYKIKSVCDLLNPMEATIEEYDLMLADMAATFDDQKMDWNPSVLFQKAEAFLVACNFNVMDSKSSEEDGQFTGEIRGLARGKYTDKRIALRIIIPGSMDEDRASVQIEALGDDIDMLPIAIGEISSGVNSWTCMNCGAAFEPHEVDAIRANQSVACHYCKHTMTIDLYRSKPTNL